ncbi:MAG: lysophospholipid acyltransferase family protein [Anaerolineae bacterium]
MKRKYRVVRQILRTLFHLLSDLEVEGLEHIPEEGAGILATNHISRLDTPLLGAVCPRRVTGMVALEYRDYPLFRWVLGAAEPIWVRRSEFDREALLESIRVLRRGGFLGLAPEGTRSPDGTLQQGKHGVAFLAARAKVPIVPVGISGTDRMVERFRKLRRMQIRVVFGEPFHLPQEGRLNPEELAAATEIIMLGIARLLPPERRGVYAHRVEAE